MPEMPGNSSVKGDEAYKSLPNSCHAKWYRDPGLRRLYVGIGLTFASATANGFDASLMNGLLAISRFHLDVVQDSSSSTLGLMIGAISLGGLAALVPAGYTSDFFGRKICLSCGTLVMVVASIAQALTTGPSAFLATKLILGAGIAFVLIPAPALTSEVAHPRSRGIVTACFQTAFYWGAIVSAAATLAGLYISSSWAWRMPVMLQILFPVLQIVGLCMIPESPRFLISKGMKSQAFDILVKFHANGNPVDALVAFEFEEICETIQREANATDGSSWKMFFATRGNRHRLLICVIVGIMIQWAGNGIVTYYLAPILGSVGVNNPTQQALINLGLQIWNAVLALVGANAMERYGRRRLWLISATGMLVCLSTLTALSAIYAELGNKVAGKAVVGFLFLFFGFYDIGFTPLSFAYPVEILPYKLRTRGLSVTLTAVFAAGFFNQYINPIALENLAWRFYFVYMGCLCIFIVLIWTLFPETAGRTLEEIAEVFDGPEAVTHAKRNASFAVNAAGSKLLVDEKAMDFQEEAQSTALINGS
uniref:Related to hexose transporter protein n=1 Tax=Ramularia collo-cygni TaxID=112498 RepID=A0A2D3V3J3_9PEZI